MEGLKSYKVPFHLNRLITAISLACTHPIRQCLRCTLPDDVKNVRIHCNPSNNPRTKLRRRSGNGCLRQSGMREKQPISLSGSFWRGRKALAIVKGKEAHDGRKADEKISRRTLSHGASDRSGIGACECPAERSERLRRSEAGRGPRPPNRLKRKHTGYGSYPPGTAEDR